MRRQTRLFLYVIPIQQLQFTTFVINTIIPISDSTTYRRVVNIVQIIFRFFDSYIDKVYSIQQPLDPKCINTKFLVQKKILKRKLKKKPFQVQDWATSVCQFFYIIKIKELIYYIM